MNWVTKLSLHQKQHQVLVIDMQDFQLIISLPNEIFSFALSNFTTLHLDQLVHLVVLPISCRRSIMYVLRCGWILISLSKKFQFSKNISNLKIIISNFLAKCLPNSCSLPSSTVTLLSYNV